MTIPELTWSLVADRLTEGATMYSDVWDNLSPLSATFYWIMSLIFNESIIAEQILSVILILTQAAIFNTILINHGALSENTYIPAAVYVVLASLFFDFLILSPVVLANTFVLLAINNVFGQIEIRAKRDEKLLMTGVYLGIAMLFHFPYFVFGPITLIMFFVFTATITRRYFLFLFGWTLPFVLAMLYYYFHDSFGLFWSNFVRSWFLVESRTYLSTYQVLILTGYCGLFIIIALLRIFGRARLTNYQSRLIQAVFLMMIMSGSVLFIELDRYPYIYLLFIFPAAFFISHLFTLIKKGFKGEFVFIVFVAVILAINYNSIEDSKNKGILNIPSYFVDGSKQAKSIEGKKILYLGDNVSMYQWAQTATPFINWRLSSGVWKNSQQLKNLTIIGKSIEEESPSIIIDPDGLLNPVLQRAPKLANKYRKDGEIYYLKSNN